LLNFLGGFGGVRAITEIDHYLWRLTGLPRLPSLPQFVFGPRVGIDGRGPEALPEDTDHEIGLVDLH
jgi:hypothetical protein